MPNVSDLCWNILNSYEKSDWQTDQQESIYIGQHHNKGQLQQIFIQKLTKPLSLKLTVETKYKKDKYL